MHLINCHNFFNELFTRASKLLGLSHCMLIFWVAKFSLSIVYFIPATTKISQLILVKLQNKIFWTMETQSFRYIIANKTTTGLKKMILVFLVVALSVKQKIRTILAKNSLPQFKIWFENMFINNFFTFTLVKVLNFITQ